MLALWLALACGPGPADPIDGVVDTGPGPERTLVEGLVRIPAPGPGMDWGWVITAGSDLDHDGVLEWAASYRYGPDGDPATVHVFEGAEALTSRTVVRPSAFTLPTYYAWFGEHLAAGGDADGDGFPDLLISEYRESWDITDTSRTHVVTSTSSADDVTVLEAQPSLPMGLTFVDLGAGRWAMATLVDGGMTSFLSALPLGDLDAETQLTEEHHVFSRAVGDAPKGSMWGLRAGWGPTVELGVTGAEIGQAFRCPLLEGTLPDLTSGCEVIAEAPLDPAAGDHTVGYTVRSADLDGDGAPEVSTSGRPSEDADGALQVYDDDGTLLATVRGTHGNGFGAHPAVLTDDAGDVWVLVTEDDGSWQATLFAFRADQLVGDLVDEDAARTLSIGEPGRLWHPTPYRATPDGPLQILATDPWRDGGVVYLFDW